MFDIEYGGKRASSLGIRVANRPGIPVPEKNITETRIAGRDGNLIETDETFSDMEIEIEMNFIQKPKEWGMSVRRIKKWMLQSEEKKLRFSDDVEVFYKVKNVNLDIIERTVKEAGEFTAIFLCDPYTYLVDGQREMSIADVLYNPYALSKPIYMITGEGMCTLTVNEKSVTANIGQNLTINTDLMMAYRKDGTMMNTDVTGDYENLWLNPGENSISITSGFSISVIPNWRCL